MILDDEIKNGSNIVVTGRRGGGKSSTVICAIQRWMKADKNNRYCILNIPMIYCDKDGNEKLATPPHVYSVSDVESLFRRVSAIMQDHKKNLGRLQICIVFDEAQNLFMGEEHQKASQMTKLLGIWRKFCASCVLITPTTDNLLPRLRRFVISEGGYMSSQWIKSDRIRVGDHDPRDFVWIKHDKKDKPEPLMLTQTSWCKPPEKGKSGYYYDHLSVSSMDLERPQFNIPDLITAISGVMSKDVPDKLKEYLDNLGSADSGKKAEPTVEIDYTDHDMRLIKRLRSADGKVTWATIGYVWEVGADTIRQRYSRWELAQKIDKDDG